MEHTHDLSQKEKVLMYLKAHGEIGPKECIQTFWITKLSTRIGELERESGIKIYKGRDKRTKFRRYFLEEERLDKWVEEDPDGRTKDDCKDNHRQ